MAGAGEDSDQQRAGVSLLLFQQRFNRGVRGSGSFENWRTHRVFNAERFDNVEVTIDRVRVFRFSRRLRGEVREEIERAPRAPGIQPPWRAGEKTEQVGFRQAVQIDHEVVLRSADITDKLEDAPNRNERVAVTQTNAID